MTDGIYAWLVIGAIIVALIAYAFTGPAIDIVVPAEPFTEGFK